MAAASASIDEWLVSREARGASEGDADHRSLAAGHAPRPWREAGRRFRRWLHQAPPRARVVLLAGRQLDGLAAGVVLRRACERGGRSVRLLIPPRGAAAWDGALLARLASGPPSVLVALGVGGPVAPPPAGLPVLVVDHRPLVEIPGVTVISGAGWQPPPSTSSLVYWLAQSIADVRKLGWVAALGAMAALGERTALELVAEARRAHGGHWLRELLPLLRAAGRAAEPPIDAMVRLLGQARDPRDAITAERPELMQVLAARDEVEAAIEAAKAVAPAALAPLTLVRLDSPCQIETVLARIWAARRPAAPVLVGNAGDFSGRVGFATLAAGDPAWRGQFLAALPAGALLEPAAGDAPEMVSGAVAAGEWPALLARLGLPASAWPASPVRRAGRR